MQLTIRLILRTKNKVNHVLSFLKEVVEPHQPQVQVIGIAWTQIAKASSQWLEKEIINTKMLSSSNAVRTVIFATKEKVRNPSL